MEKIIRVLIVDDGLEARDGLESILRAYADLRIVGVASGGPEAILMADQLRPDVVLVDSQMPGMDGVETIRQLKERLPEAKVILLTVHASHIEAGLTAGADGFLLKDCRRQDLVDGIRHIFKGGSSCY